MTRNGAALAALACALAALPLAAAHAHPGPNPFYLPDPVTSVHAPARVEIPAGSDHHAVRIWGTLEDGASLVSVRVEGPLGAPAHLAHSAVYLAGVAEGRYETYHPVPGDGRHLEGEYSVTVSAEYSGFARNATATFYVDVLWYDPPDVRIHLGDSSVLPACQYRGCPPESGGPYAVPQGGSVEWENGGGVPHHIYSVAEGYGSQRPDVVREPGPNTFDGGVVPPGDHARAVLESPGSVIFTCRFHPWMEGLILVESAAGEPDGRGVRDPPSSVLDILEGAGADYPPGAPERRGDGREHPDALEYERAALEEELRRLEAERLAAEIEALGRIAQGEAPRGAAPPEVRVLESPVGLWGGVISAAVLWHGPDAPAVYLEGPDGAEVLRTLPDGRNVAIPVQPTWHPGTYTLRAGDAPSGGSSAVEIRASPESCIGDAVSGGRLLCLAGTVTGTTGGYVYIDGSPVRLAGVEGTLPPDVCREGATAVADFDPGLGRGVASVWCDGVYVNEALAGQDLPAACESERPPSACAASRAQDAPEDSAKVPREDSQKSPQDSQKSPQEDSPGDSRGAPDSGHGGAAPSGAARDARPPPGGDCPIALISYGTALAEPVQILREYRDGLAGSWHAPLLDGVHEAYYSASPLAADALRDHGILADAARAILTAPLHALAWLVG